MKILILMNILICGLLAQAPLVKLRLSGGICSKPKDFNASVKPCTITVIDRKDEKSLVSIFLDAEGKKPLMNPFKSQPNGRYSFYVAENSEIIVKTK